MLDDYERGYDAGREDAAEQVEKLRAALTQIMELGYHSLDPDVDKRMTEIAREALQVRPER